MLRKKQFVTPDYPARAKFAKLTKQEENAGLLNGDFGFWKRHDWQQFLHQHGLPIL